MRKLTTKLIMPLAAGMVAIGAAAPASAQSSTVPDTRAAVERCNAIADPGLKAQCMTQSYTGGDRLLGMPGAPATAPLVPTTPNKPDIVPGQPIRR